MQTLALRSYCCIPRCQILDVIMRIQSYCRITRCKNLAVIVELSHCCITRCKVIAAAKASL